MVITIRKGGIYRVCSKVEHERLYKGQGYVVEEIEEAEEEIEPDNDILDIEQYAKSGGWYEYEGKSYRKNDLMEVIK